MLYDALWADPAYKSEQIYFTCLKWLYFKVKVKNELIGMNENIYRHSIDQRKSTLKENKQ